MIDWGELMDSIGLVTHWILPKAIHSRNKSSNARVTKSTRPARDGCMVIGGGHRYNLRPRVYLGNGESRRSPRSHSQERGVTTRSKLNRDTFPKTGDPEKASTSRPPSLKTSISSPLKSCTKRSINRRQSRVAASLSIRNKIRSTSPSPFRLNPSAVSETVQNLKQRIQAIPIQNRNVPKTNDIGLLGFELKTRLAMTSPMLVESVKRGGKVQVKSRLVSKRFIPLWEISPQQDPTLICKVQVKRPHSRS